MEIKKYAILQNPGHNRVYFESSGGLALCELSLAAEKMQACAENMKIENYGGIPYVTFTAANALTEQDVIILSRLSFFYALFEIEDCGKSDARLLPIEKNHSYYFGDDLNMILKYSGKTNEMFTRLMINTAYFLSGVGQNDNIALLDPLCGKGTTLFECMILGYDAYGIEIFEKQVDEARAFFKNYLERGRYKHRFERRLMTLQNNPKPDRIKRYSCTLAKNKSDKKINRELNFEIVCGDSSLSAQIYKKNSFDMIVCDLPYGIQHQNSAAGNRARNPLPLLAEALPNWLQVLKPGGCVTLSWNTFLASSQEMERLFLANHLHIPEVFRKLDFSHRVDQAITRNIMTGRKSINN